MNPISALLSKSAETAGISHAELGNRMGLSRPMVNLQLSGKRPIGLDRALQFADALNLGEGERRELFNALENADPALASFSEFKMLSVFEKSAVPFVLKIFAASPLLDEPVTPVSCRGVNHPIFWGRIDLASRELPKLRIFAGFQAEGPKLALGVPHPARRDSPPQKQFYLADLTKPLKQQPDVVRALADNLIDFDLYKVKKFRRSMRKNDKSRIRISE